MAFQSSPVLDFSFKAEEDLRDYQYRFVKINDSNLVRKIRSNEYPDGVLQNAPNEGEEATIRILGISKVVAYSGLRVGTFISPDFETGYAKASCAGDLPNYVSGRVFGASIAKEDLCSVLLTPYVGITSW